ncbi:hypothetical protein GIY11_02235 [Aerococcaceae bacterium DSM 109653]|uniref:O-antigen ligase-related domain-containing protein n=1 Tax=Fundicoccus ignavus TaxID=2664442 RepID=A0A844BWN4_9LACT|nr:O-antigen ligase family protein [Fundicoccus ignavus]MRI80847.1 hypothetical protein [Fundicoccus ignavus]
MRNYLSGLMYSAIILAFFSWEYSIYLQLALASLMIFGLIWGVARSDIRFNVIIQPYSIMMLLLVIWSFTSIFWVADRTSWIISNGILTVTLIYGVSLSWLIREKLFRQHLSLVIIGIMIVHHVIGWFEVLSNQQYRLAERWSFDWLRQLHNPMLFFGNINDFALLCFFGLIFMMCWHPLDDKLRDMDGQYFSGFRTFENYSKTKTLALVSFKLLMTVSSLLLIYFANARGILFAAAYAMVFYLILHIKSAWLRRIVILFLGFICLVTVLMVYTDILDALWQDGSFVIRYNLIRNGWHHLKASHYLGVGAGNTEYYMEHFNYYYTGGYRVMHNWWMGMLVEYGLPFFILYGVYHARVFLYAYYLAVKYDSQTGKWVATWLLGFIVAGFIPNTLFNFVWFWFIHNFVFVWFEYRLSTMELTDRALGLEFKLNYKLKQFSEWLDRKLVKEG